MPITMSISLKLFMYSSVRGMGYESRNFTAFNLRYSMQKRSEAHVVDANTICGAHLIGLAPMSVLASIPCFCAASICFVVCPAWYGAL